MEQHAGGSEGVRRRRRGDLLRVKRSMSTACSRAIGGDVLQVKRSRSRAKRSSDVEGALRRWWRAPGKAVKGEGEAIERHQGRAP
jgi:hypothetical protein